MKFVYSFENSGQVRLHDTQRNVQEDKKIQGHSCDILDSCIDLPYFMKDEDNRILSETLD
jgi:hypothetical protein